MVEYNGNICVMSRRVFLEYIICNGKMYCKLFVKVFF